MVWYTGNRQGAASRSPADLRSEGSLRFAFSVAQSNARNCPFCIRAEAASVLGARAAVAAVSAARGALGALRFQARASAS